MFITKISMETLNEIEDFMASDKCDFVDSMNKAGLSFSAMAFVIDAIIRAVSDTKEKLIEKSED